MMLKEYLKKTVDISLFSGELLKAFVYSFEPGADFDIDEPDVISVKVLQVDKDNNSNKIADFISTNNLLDLNDNEINTITLI